MDGVIQFAVQGQASGPAVIDVSVAEFTHADFSKALRVQYALSPDAPTIEIQLEPSRSSPPNLDYSSPHSMGTICMLTGLAVLAVMRRVKLYQSHRDQHQAGLA